MRLIAIQYFNRLTALIIIILLLCLSCSFHTLFQTLTHTHSHTLTQTHIHTHLLTHTHTHTHKLSHQCISFILVRKERLPEPQVDVGLRCRTLEVQCTEPRERELFVS